MILEILFIVFVAFLTAYLLRHFFFTFAVLFNTKESSNKEAKLSWRPKVSIFIPAKNEEKVIGRILHRMTELTYPKEKLEVIVVNDGSSDRTGEIAEEFSKKYGFIRVIHRKKDSHEKGKPAALNEALKKADGEILYCFDADYYPQKDIIEKLNEGFSDPSVGAVQGRVTVLNEPETIVTRIVALERIGGYRIDQEARAKLGLIPQFGGTVGGFRREVLEELGGWDPKILAEDTDLTFRLYLAGYKIHYDYNVECYEEAVNNWRGYWRQRYRWALGHMQVAFKHILSLIKSKNLRLLQKLDGFFLLNIYFVPIIVALTLVFGTLLFVLRSPVWLPTLWSFVPISIYCAVGNFAPFFEIGIGAYLDRRERVYWILPLLGVAFFYNVFICSTAFFSLCLSKLMGKKHNWMKTLHNGCGNCYIGIEPKNSTEYI